jgi:hypothetical protein
MWRSCSITTMRGSLKTPPLISFGEGFECTTSGNGQVTPNRAGMNSVEYQSRREHADRSNIHFLGPAQPSCWPDTLRRLFTDVQKLGGQKYDDFSENVTIDSIEKPWRLQTKKRAERLAKLVETCREERRNEAGWRYCIEPEVLHRFTIEVAWWVKSVCLLLFAELGS